MEHMASSADALDDLAERLNARLNGMALQSLAQGVPGQLPPTTGHELARISIEWLTERVGVE